MDSGFRNGWHRLLAAAVASNAADGLRLAGLPLLAAALTRDPRLVAGLTAATTLPWLLARCRPVCSSTGCGRARCS